MSAKKTISVVSASYNNSQVHINSSGFSTGAVLSLNLARGIGCASAVVAGITIGATNARADTTFQEMGITQLQQVAPGLDGAGVVVGQVEASLVDYNPNVFEPNPAITGQPAADFTFINSSGVSSGTYESTQGSWHASDVGQIFYGGGGYGIAEGVSHIYVSAESGYLQNLKDFANSSSGAYAPPGSVNGVAGVNTPSVVNQSFIVFESSASYGVTLDALWDNYAARFNTLYVSAIGDGQTVSATAANLTVSYINPPSDMYNGIAVGVYTGTVDGAIYGPSSGQSSAWIGPTADGRSKPDLVASAPALGAWTSYTTPEVSGVATLMEQAGRGTNLSGPVGLSSSDAAIIAQGTTAYTAAATDIRTVKALLLNGAVKPAGWTNSYTVNNGTYTYHAVSANAITPLDPRYGSGVVNAYNSYENLAGGEHNYSAVDSAVIASLPTVTSAPPGSFSGSYTQTVSSANPTTMEGWNLATIAAGTTCNSVENYDFSLPGTSANAWDLTATLTWNKDYNASGINHLLLFLLNSSGQQMAASVSLLDNVQQININPALGINPLTPGQYDLAVEMLGGVNAISTSDTYALAWNFTDPTSAPEPGVLPLLALGAGMLLMARPRIASGHA